ncbi:MAG TPA: cytochrome c oxidase subunit II [Luteibaculaceae bacterium]|nr:cytochrome c oxidase subunit II [Luteibaculaceae bacterium]
MSKLLIVLVLVLAVIAIAQLTRLYELSRTLRGKKEEEISLANNKMNAWLWVAFMLSFYAFFGWLTYEYGDKMLPEAASEHGKIVDGLMDFNLVLVTVVFFITNSVLFYFCFKYYARPDRKALFYPHNNKLEFIWTIVPTCVLAVVIIYGLKTWNDITDEASEDALVIELYSRQFDWAARYAGQDGKLGKASFNFLANDNALGLINDASYSKKLGEIETEIQATEEKLANEAMSDANEEAARVKLRRLKAQLLRIKSLKSEKGEMGWANDDKIVKAEFHIPVGKEIKFLMRSQDVIHSAFMPHFRAQMNTVPGMSTTFRFTPTITTAEMRKKLNNPKFNYILLCNKICGAAHYNMQMNIIVESEEDYKKWLAEQKTFTDGFTMEPATTENGETKQDSTSAIAATTIK